MIDTCCEKAVYLDMKFNALKSNSIRYGPKCTDLNRDCMLTVCVDRVKYLGVYLMSAKSCKVCWHEPKKNFLDRQHAAKIAFSASTK